MLQTAHLSFSFDTSIVNYHVELWANAYFSNSYFLKQDIFS